MEILYVYIDRRYQVFGEKIKYTPQGRRIYRLMFSQINVDIDTVITYEEHKIYEAKYIELMQKLLSEIDPDNDDSEFTNTRNGQLEFTPVGKLLYGMLYGRALIDIRTINTRVKFENTLSACHDILIDCWIDFSRMYPGRSLFIDKMAAIFLDDEQKADDIEEQMLIRDAIKLC